MRRLGLVTLTWVVAVAAMPALAEARREKVASFPVTFTVQNVNRSLLPCATDGATYEIRGRVTGPRRSKARRSRPGVTLYLHGLGFGEWFWSGQGPLRPGAVPGPGTPVRIRGYDYASAQARNGHFSVTVDRLGYGASSLPPGLNSCLGGQADIAHQVVQALKSGTYSVAGGKPVRYKRVALVGHSIGAQIAMTEAYSFRDVDALVAASFSFQNLPAAQLALGPTRDKCVAGGEPVVPGGSSGYAYYGQPSPADFESIMFSKAKEEVLQAAGLLRSRDPCGDIGSIIPALVQQRAQLGKIKVPVLVICGTRDALFGPLGCRSQAERFVGSRRVKVQLVRGAGHGVTLDRGAATFRRKLARWLRGYRF